MNGRDHHELQRRAIRALTGAGRAASNAPSMEGALDAISRAVFELLGNRAAHLRCGALKDGEHQFFVAGYFVVTPDEDTHILVAEHGFPPQQHRLRIPIDLGHPGAVYRTRTPLILENTDEHPDFRQILKTSRMGSALFCPMFQREQMVAQLLMAAQARNTFEPVDLEILEMFAQLAALAWNAFDGDAFVVELAGDAG